MEKLAAVFGQRVRALREARKWTQEELAKRAGIGPKHIGVIERAEKASSFEAVENLARAFDVAYPHLFVQRTRRTTAMKKELDELMADASRIKLANVEDFL